MSTPDLQALLTDLIAVAKQAGDAILKVYDQDFSITHKADKSPLTQDRFQASSKRKLS